MGGNKRVIRIFGQFGNDASQYLSIETVKEGYEIYSKLTIKTAKRRL